MEPLLINISLAPTSSVLKYLYKRNLFAGTRGKMYSANYNRRKNLIILFNNTTLIPFKWRMKYMCFYCGRSLDDYSELREHTIDHGICTENDRAIRLVKAPDSEVKIDVSDVTCRLCDKMLSNMDDIIDHLVSNHRKSYDREVQLAIAPYSLRDLKCLSCSENFRHFRALIVHVNRAHPNNCFVCRDCELKFNKKRDLDRHYRVHHRKRFKCPKCLDDFSTYTDYQRHRSNAHVSTCNICFKAFSTSTKRLVHMKTDHDLDLAECGFCKKIMTTRQGFLRHATQCTPKYELKSPQVVVVDDDKKPSIKEIRKEIANIFNMSTAMPFKFFMTKFRCFYCSEDFQKCDSLKKHTLAEHPYCDVSIKSMRLRHRYEGLQIKVDTSALACKLCFEPVDSMSSLFDHLKSEHKSSCDESVAAHIQGFKLMEDNYVCPYCDEVFRYFSVLLKHVSVRHTDNKYICVYCGKSFRTNPNLRSHVIGRHDNPSREKCEKCGLVLKSKNTLRLHTRKVHCNKRVECTECQETFTTNYSMYVHKRDVHGIGHKCDYCLKIFAKNSAMVNHMRRAHLKEKNVQCSVCFESFFDVQRLKTHMVKHAGKRNYQCDVCGKRFLWKKNLRGHVVSHNKNNQRTLIT